MKANTPKMQPRGGTAKRTKPPAMDYPGTAEPGGMAGAAYRRMRPGYGGGKKGS